MKVASSTQQPTQKIASSDVRTTGRTQESKKPSRTSTTNGPSRPASREMTELSGKSKELAQAKSSALNAPEIREDLVMDLKKQVDTGNYKINPEIIAERLLSEHLDTPYLD